MTDEKIKRKQLRRTFDDTKTAQKQLRELILNKIENKNSLTPEEKNIWMDLIANSFLSVGVDQKIYIETPNIRICFGTLHTFALRFLDWDSKVVYTYQKHNYSFDIETLWEKLYSCCLEIFPYALSDALHMSKETEEREQWQPFSFSSNQKLEENL